MYICVRLLTSLSQPLWYHVPEELASQYHDWHTAIVQVPLRGRVVAAVVLVCQPEKPINLSFAIKPIVGRDPFPADATYHAFLQKLGYYYQIGSWVLLRRLVQFLQQKKQLPHEEIPYLPEQSKQQTLLTAEQSAVINYLEEPLLQGRYTPTMVHGVTGSGKTHVYKELIIRALADNKTVILLLPEVTLAVAFEQQFKKLLPATCIVSGFHSSTTPRIKKKLWQDLLAQKPLLIIGVHLPILLPIANLGLIIIDEEHETGYQEKKHPKINSKQAAIIRAQLVGIPIVLGSATPSIETLYRVKTEKWKFFQLKQRFTGALPTIKKVILPEQQKRKNFWISPILQKEIAHRIAKKEQAIIFINRRGYCFFVQCGLCSFIFSCAFCSVSMTLHHNNSLICHYCGTTDVLPTQCPTCQAESSEFLKKGIGTQQIVELLQKEFPTARIERADMEISSKKDAWQQLLHDVSSGAIDILVGTQTIAKGYHFPKVTLVGIIWADVNIHFPAYNASESCLQQLIQVAGRAGRATKESLVIIQTMSDHPIFACINEIDYLTYYKKEIAAREILGYPPCGNFVVIELRNETESTLIRESHEFALLLCQYVQKEAVAVQILGPACPPVYKINNVHTRVIHIKSADFDAIVHAYQHALTAHKYTSSISFTPNPLSM